MRKTVLSFGETLWDLLPSGPKLGGAPFNLAYRIQTLGDRGVIVTRLGRDDYGWAAYDQMHALGLERSFVQWDNHCPTGTVEVKVDEQGNPDFTIRPHVAYDFIELTYDVLELAAAADCLCFGTLSQRAPTSRRTLQRLRELAGRQVRFLDLNLRRDCHTPEIVREAIQAANVLKLNAPEAAYLAEFLGRPGNPLPDFCRALLERWPLACCVVTLGERGAFAASADGAQVYVPGYEVEVVDTCGSGDAFSAAFLHEYLRGQALGPCCQLGNALGALVAQQSGATASVRPDELEKFLASPGPRIVESGLQSFAAC
jgi:fructokinase